MNTFPKSTDYFKLWLSISLVDKLQLTKVVGPCDKSSDLICSDICCWYCWQNWWALSWQKLTKVVILTKAVDINWQKWWAVTKVVEVTKVGATHDPLAHVKSHSSLSGRYTVGPTLLSSRYLRTSVIVRWHRAENLARADSRYLSLGLAPTSRPLYTLY